MQDRIGINVAMESICDLKFKDTSEEPDLRQDQKQLYSTRSKDQAYVTCRDFTDIAFRALPLINMACHH